MSTTMADRESSSPLAASPDSRTSSTSSSHTQVDPAPGSLSLEESSNSISTDASSSNIDPESFQASLVELLDDAIHDTTLLYQSHSITSSTPPPSPSSTSTTHNPPSNPPSQHDPLSQTIFTIYTPMPIEERLQRRADCLLRLHQGRIPDPFGEWASLASGLYGGTTPPEFYLTSAPFSLHSLRGRVRLRYIRTAFCMPPDATVFQIEAFLSRNPSVVRYLLFNVLPSPDLIFRENSRDYQIHVNRPASQKYYRRLLRAIKQLDWMDETVEWVAELARTEDERTLSTLYKVREVEILRNVYGRMLEMEESSRPKKIERWHTQVVVQMRRNRPNSLLRHVIMPQDVVEETW